MGGLGLSCFKLEARAQCKEPVMRCEHRRLTVPNSFHYGPWTLGIAGLQKGYGGHNLIGDPASQGLHQTFGELSRPRDNRRGIMFMRLVLFMSRFLGNNE